MKIKNLVFISILLMIFLSCAVSASDNSTFDDADSSDLNMNSDDEIIIIGNETWDVQVDKNPEVLPAPNQSIALHDYPEDTRGNVSFSIDDVRQDFTNHDSYLMFDATNLTFGQHKYDLSFSGDEKYAPTIKSGILNVSPILFEFPSTVYLTGSNYIIDDDSDMIDNQRSVKVFYLKGLKDNVHLYINGLEKVLNLTDYHATTIVQMSRYDWVDVNLISLDESGNFYVYEDFFYFDRPTNITATYDDGNFSIMRSSFVDVNYEMDCEDKIIKGNDFGIIIPKGIKSKVTVEIDGKPVNIYSKKVETDYTRIFFYTKAGSLSCEKHSVKINFLGNEKCKPRSVYKLFTVLKAPNVTPKKISVYYTGAKTCTLTLSGTGDIIKFGQNVIVSVKNNYKFMKIRKGGKIYYKIPSNLKPGTYAIKIEKNGFTLPSVKLAQIKLVVKHIVTLKKANVKKSAKKLVLTASLKKVNGKYLNGKKVTFKFNGKTYHAKTNKNGVAKVTIKKAVLKKLKVGKKLTYSATYGKDIAKKIVKIKR